MARGGGCRRGLPFPLSHHRGPEVSLLLKFRNFDTNSDLEVSSGVTFYRKFLFFCLEMTYSDVDIICHTLDALLTEFSCY